MNALDRLYARHDGPIAPALVRAARLGPAEARARRHAAEAAALADLLASGLRARARHRGRAGLDRDTALRLRAAALAYCDGAGTRAAP